MLDNGVGCRFCQQNVVAGTLTIKLCQYTLLITIYSMASFNVNFLMAFMLLFQPSELQQGQQMRRIQPISISSYQNEGWTMRMAWLLLNRWKMFNAKSDGSLQFGFEMKQYISTILVTNQQNLVKHISTIYFLTLHLSFTPILISPDSHLVYYSLFPSTN